MKDRKVRDTACRPCPAYSATLYYYGGSNQPYQPASISYPGAKMPNYCLPEFTAVNDANWWLPCDAGLLFDASAAAVEAGGSRVDSLQACTKACRDAGCQFVNFNYSSNSCLMRLPPAASGR